MNNLHFDFLQKFELQGVSNYAVNFTRFPLVPIMQYYTFRSENPKVYSLMSLKVGVIFITGPVIDRLILSKSSVSPLKTRFYVTEYGDNLLSGTLILTL